MKLSLQQKKIVELISSKNNGKFIIRACPGSGKTFTVAHLLAEELKLWGDLHHGIAVLSFTNNAKDEIQKKILKNTDYKNSINYPHFIGTIDSFLNNYLFLPFGNVMMGSRKKPRLIGGINSQWKEIDLINRYCEHNYFDKTSFDKKNNLIPTVNMQAFPFKWFKKNGQPTKHIEKIKSSKINFFKKGLATQDDVNYLTYKTLERNPEIVKIFVRRFPYLILDEAQDTSDMQMGIIDILIENGLKKIVLVGDPDQAIYEWNQAKPSLFLNKIRNKKWISEGLELSESFRSSSNICTFASKFSNNKFKPAKNNKSKDFNKNVVLKKYDIKKIEKEVFDESTELVKSFLKECSSMGIDINSKKVAILSRSKDLLFSIKNQKSTRENKNVDWRLCKKKYTKEACLARYYYENGNYKKAFDHATKWCFYYSNLEENYPGGEILKNFIELEKGGHNKVFKGSMKACHRKLPSIKKFPDICTWLRESTIKEPKMDIFEGSKFDDIFYQQKDNKLDENSPLYSTIHGIKGGTFDAVLLFLKTRGGRGSKNYKTYLENVFSLDEENMEELRIVYVAITRPKKILWIVVPRDDFEEWEKFTKNSE